VSGLALGIDTIAHTAALDAGGRTIGVLARGLDIIYPPTNRGLARRMVESGQGVLITEYPLGVQPVVGTSPKSFLISKYLAEEHPACPTHQLSRAAACRISYRAARSGSRGGIAAPRPPRNGS
jgi:DNA processing protein